MYTVNVITAICTIGSALLIGNRFLIPVLSKISETYFYNQEDCTCSMGNLGFNEQISATIKTPDFLTIGVKPYIRNAGINGPEPPLPQNPQFSQDPQNPHIPQILPTPPTTPTPQTLETPHHIEHPHISPNTFNYEGLMKKFQELRAMSNKDFNLEGVMQKIEEMKAMSGKDFRKQLREMLHQFVDIILADD